MNAGRQEPRAVRDPLDGSAKCSPLALNLAESGIANTLVVAPRAGATRVTLASVRTGLKCALGARSSTLLAAIGCYLPPCRVRDLLALSGWRLPL